MCCLNLFEKFYKISYVVKIKLKKIKICDAKKETTAQASLLKYFKVWLLKVYVMQQNSKLLIRVKPGRPLEDISRFASCNYTIASATAGPDGKRRTDILDACHTDELRAALLKEGYI